MLLTYQELILTTATTKANKLLAIVASWENDPAIQHFITPRMTTEEIPLVSSNDLADNLLSSPAKHMYIVYDDDKPIGNYTIDTSFGMLKSNYSHTAWISIIIGDKEYWGKGIGKEIMGMVEISCKALGSKFIELGVFSFNERAIKLYSSMGYKPCAIVKNFVYYDNRFWDDYRLIKKI